MKVRLLMLLLLYIGFSCEKPADCPSPFHTLNLQPDSTTGKDAYIGSISPTVNYGKDTKIYTNAWTYNLKPSNIYFMLQFDYSNIPDKAEINSATLYLYADTSDVFAGTPYPMAGHYSGGGDSTYLKRITSRWDEQTVSWTTKPSSTTTNKITFPVTTDSAQAFKIDVTKIVLDQIKYGNYGFEFGLLRYLPYQRLEFYSSESAFSSLRPKLIINYKKV